MAIIVAFTYKNRYTVDVNIIRYSILWENASGQNENDFKSPMLRSHKSELSAYGGHPLPVPKIKTGGKSL